jgi:hypothetical protein
VTTPQDRQAAPVAGLPAGLGFRLGLGDMGGDFLAKETRPLYPIKADTPMRQADFRYGCAAMHHGMAFRDIFSG